MSIKGMNHAVLYVRDSTRHRQFYEDVLDFVTVIDEPGQFAFMRAPRSDNHHDIAFFTIGEQAQQSAAGRETVGLYHLAWEVETLGDRIAMERRLSAAGVIKGASDHGANKSLYCMDPDGLEFEVMWLVPTDRWGEEEHEAIIRPLNLDEEAARFPDMIGASS